MILLLNTQFNKLIATARSHFICLISALTREIDDRASSKHQASKSKTMIAVSNRLESTGNGSKYRNKAKMMIL